MVLVAHSPHCRTTGDCEDHTYNLMWPHVPSLHFPVIGWLSTDPSALLWRKTSLSCVTSWKGPWGWERHSWKAARNPEWPLGMGRREVTVVVLRSSNVFRGATTTMDSWLWSCASQQEILAHRSYSLGVCKLWEGSVEKKKKGRERKLSIFNKLLELCY